MFDGVGCTAVMAGGTRVGVQRGVRALLSGGAGNLFVAHAAGAPICSLPLGQRRAPPARVLGVAVRAKQLYS